MPHASESEDGLPSAGGWVSPHAGGGGDGRGRGSEWAGRGRGGRLGLWSWALYDWANSAYSAMIVTFVFAAYFAKAVVGDEVAGQAMWGHALSLSGLGIALGGPILGAIADQTGRRKPWIAAFTLLCIFATALLSLVAPQRSDIQLALTLAIVSNLGTEFATLFYNAMLPAIAPKEALGRWSGWGWAVGYAGGLACLTLGLLGFVGKDPWITLPKEGALHVRATFLLTAGWYAVFALPLFLFTPDEPRTPIPYRKAISLGLRQLGTSLRHVREFGHILRFLVAKMLYTDGVNTIFALGGVYAATAYGMEEGRVMLFGILLNVTGGVGAAAFAFLDDRVGSRRIIMVSLIGLIVCASIAIMSTHAVVFWYAGLTLGLFVGPVQASSRSYLAHVAPPSLENEMFGLYALSGKATAFAGPLLVALVTTWTGSNRAGLSVVLVFLAAGLALMFAVPDEKAVAGGA